MHETAIFPLLILNHVPLPRFPWRRENFGDSRTFKADIGLLIFAWVFRNSWLKYGFGAGDGAKWGKGWCDIDRPTNCFYFLGSYVRANFGENRSRNATLRVPTDGYTHWQTQTGYIMCPIKHSFRIRYGTVPLIPQWAGVKLSRIPPDLRSGTSSLWSGTLTPRSVTLFFRSGT